MIYNHIDGAIKILITLYKRVYSLGFISKTIIMSTSKSMLILKI